MAETAHLVKYPMYVEDLGLGAGTTTVTIQSTGYTRTLLDSRNFPLSTATKTVYGLSGTQYLDAVLTTLSTSTAVATTAARGIVKVDDNASGDPIALTTVGTLAGRIPTAAISNALTGSAQALDYGNAVVSRYEMQLALSLSLGSGKDGYGQLGAIAASSTAPTITSVATSGLLTGTYTYKIAAYNLSGTIVASSASASTGAITTKQVRLTLPALPSGAMGWRIYRSTDGANWYYVGSAVKGYNYTETASDAKQYIYDDNVPYPNTGVSAPGSDTTGTSATLSGLFQFITFTLAASQTINVATSGSYAGIFDVRVQVTFTPNATATINNVGTNRVNVGKFILAGGTSHSYLVATGQTALMAIPADQTFSPTTLYPMASPWAPPLGFGADISMSDQNWSGFGTKGGVYGTLSGGDGGWGGGFTRIWCYQIASCELVGTFNSTGQAGTAGTGTASQGGGGGGGGIIDIRAVVPWKDSSTTNAAGGAGGAASGSGGATTITGAPGGGGGLIIRGNCFDTSAATSTVAAGANGANATAAAAAATGRSYSGAHYGNGGFCTGSTAVTSGSAGQTIALNGYFDSMPIFAA